MVFNKLMSFNIFLFVIAITALVLSILSLTKKCEGYTDSKKQESIVTQSGICCSSGDEGSPPIPIIFGNKGFAGNEPGGSQLDPNADIGSAFSNTYGNDFNGTTFGPGGALSAACLAAGWAHGVSPGPC